MWLGLGGRIRCRTTHHETASCNICSELVSNSSTTKIWVFGYRTKPPWLGFHLFQTKVHQIFESTPKIITRWLKLHPKLNRTAESGPLHYHSQVVLPFRLFHALDPSMENPDGVSRSSRQPRASPGKAVDSTEQRRVDRFIRGERELHKSNNSRREYCAADDEVYHGQ